MSYNEVTLLLGSNLGDRKSNINNAIKLLELNGCQIIKKTKIIETNPVEFASNNIFCNIALLISTLSSPIKLLNIIKKIEYLLGRIEDSSIKSTYEDRTIDIDIVLFNSLVYSSKRLEIPHKKHILERDFSIGLLYLLEKEN